jgi:hypothetical protein
MGKLIISPHITVDCVIGPAAHRVLPTIMTRTNALFERRQGSARGRGRT